MLKLSTSSNSTSLAWTDPHSLISEKARVFLYFARVVDEIDDEYRYIGKTKYGQWRLGGYRNNIERIFNGLPRRTTRGQEKYRAVHLALAKACKHGWRYEFNPLEKVGLSELNEAEKRHISQLRSNLNGARLWSVEQFGTLSICDLTVLTC